MAAIEVEGLSPDIHKSLNPKRWLYVRSSWGTFRRAFIIIPAFMALNWGFGEGFHINKSDMTLFLGYFSHAFWVAVDPPVPHTSAYLDSTSAWVKFRAWVSS